MRKIFCQRQIYANKKFYKQNGFRNQKTIGILLFYCTISQNKISHKVFYCKKFTNVLYFFMSQVFK